MQDSQENRAMHTPASAIVQPSLRWPQSGFDPSPYLMDPSTTPPPFHTTALGALWAADCLKILPLIRDGCIHTIFADPPFNIGKEYGAGTDDQKDDGIYVAWCRQWLAECARLLAPGGALFVYNLPRWNVLLGAYLAELGLTFRHWIAIEISACLPIPGRLHPSHYSLIYYTKGKPKTFRRIRTPILRCRHCGGEVKDYGGHRKAMNPNGVNLKDVWTDIPPVRHWKFKSKNRKANALSTKVLDRVVELSTVPGDMVLDPFGGSGTTYVVCESRGRKWLGTEIDYAPDIAGRLESDEIRAHKNDDFIES